MKTKHIILIIILGSILVGSVFIIPLLGDRLTYSAGLGSNQVLVTTDPNASPTPTAFQPLQATETYLPTTYPTSTPTPVPTPGRIKPANHNQGADPIPQPENQVNIMLLGSDLLPRGDSFRTDVMILVTVNKDQKTVNVTSFPRDLYVYIPGWKEQRLNTAYPHGGFPALQQTLNHNFGFQPDYYVMVNLWSFEYFVNDLGGITIDVPRNLCDSNWGHGQSHCVSAGTHTFYGREALWYVRSRQTTNDFDRNVRQQLALEAILDKFFSLNTITKVPALYQTYRENVSTNLDLDLVVSLVPTASKLKDKSRIKQYFIDDHAVNSWVTPGGAQVLLPKYQVIHRILTKALNSP